MLAKIWLAVRSVGGFLRTMIPIGVGLMMILFAGFRTTASTAGGSAEFRFNPNASIAGSIDFRPSPGPIGYAIQQTSGVDRNVYFVYSATGAGAMVRRGSLTTTGNISGQVSHTIGTQNQLSSTWFHVSVRRCSMQSGFRHAAIVNGIAFRR